MALAVEGLAHAGGSGPTHNTENNHNVALTTAPSSERSHRRNLFLIEGGGKREGARLLKVPEAVKTHYTGFLQDHIQDLLDVQDRDPAKFKQILAKRGIDRQLVDAVMNRVDDIQSRDTQYSLSDEKIAQFLDKPEGLIATTLLMQEITEMKMMTLGATAAKLAENGRGGVIKNNIIHLDVERGVLNKLRDKLPTKTQAALGVIGGVAAAGSAYMASGLSVLAMGGNPAGLLVGPGMVGAVYGAYRGVKSYLNHGMRIDIQQSTDAFKAISSNADDKEYAKEVLRIDMDDFKVVGGRIERTNDDQRTVQSIEDMQADILANINARNLFYQEFLGIPASRLSASPMQELFGGHKRPEETGTRFDARIREAFIAKGGKRGTRAEQYRHQFEAQREVIGQYLSTYTKKELEKKAPAEKNYLALMRKKKEKNADGGEPKKKATEEATKEKGKLTADKQTAEEAKAPLTAYEASRKALNEAKDEARREFTAPTLADLVLKLGDEQKKLTDAGVVGYAKDLKELIDKRETDTNTKISAITARDPRERARQEAIIREEEVGFYNSRKADLDERVKAPLEAKIAKMKALRVTIETNEEKLKAFGELGKPLEDTVKKFETDYKTVEGLAAGVAPPVVLGEAELRTLSVDEILNRINEIHTNSGGTKGWAKDDNEESEMRQKVLHAFLEAKARAKESFVLPRVAAYEQVVTALRSVGGVAELIGSDLRHLTADEILVKYTGLTPVWRSLIDQARIIAQEQLAARVDVINEYTKNTDRQVAKIDKDLATKDFTKPIITIAENVLSREALFVDEINEMIDDIKKPRIAGEEPSKYTDIRNPAIDDPLFTDAERRSGIFPSSNPRGYYEILNILTGYKEYDIREGAADGDSREKHFELLQSRLDSPRLAAYLNTALGLSIVPHGGLPVGMNNVLDRMREDIQNGRIDAQNLRSAFRQLGNILGQEALAA